MRALGDLEAARATDPGSRAFRVEPLHAAVMSSALAQAELVVAERAGRSWRTKLALRIRALLLSFDFEAAEVISGIAAVSWGAWLLLPWDSFGSTPSFNAMATLAPEWVWGLGALAHGIAQLVALASDHSDDEQPRAHWFMARQVSAFTMTLGWLFIAGNIAAGNLQGTGTVIYPIFAFASGWAYLRLRMRRSLRWRLF